MPTLECTQQKLCGDRGNTFVGPKTQPIRRRRQLMRFGIDLRTVEAKFLLLISSPLLRAQTWARWRKSGCRRAKLCAIDRVDAGLVRVVVAPTSPGMPQGSILPPFLFLLFPPCSGKKRHLTQTEDAGKSSPILFASPVLSPSSDSQLRSQLRDRFF